MTAIVASELLFKLAAPAAAAGDTDPSNPAASLGGYISTTLMDGALPLNNLFNDVTSAENMLGTENFRCFFVHNTNATNIARNAVIYLSDGGDPSGGAVVTIAVDTTAASAVGSATIQADVIADEVTPPTLVSAFAAPVDVVTGIPLGDIGIGQCKPVWVRRFTSGVAAVHDETVTFAVTCEAGV